MVERIDRSIQGEIDPCARWHTVCAIKFGNLSGREESGAMDIIQGKGLVCRLEKREDEREWLSVFDCSDVEYRFETIVRDQRYDWISNTGKLYLDR